MFRKPEGMEWLVLIALLIKLAIFLLVCFGVYFLWSKRSTIFEMVIPDDIVVRPMDVYCPEESYMLKQMYIFDHVTRKKSLMLIGSEDMVNNALKSMGDKKPMIHICNY